MSGPKVSTASLPTSSPSRRTSHARSPSPCAYRWVWRRAKRSCKARRIWASIRNISKPGCGIATARRSAAARFSRRWNPSLPAIPALLRHGRCCPVRISFKSNRSPVVTAGTVEDARRVVQSMQDKAEKAAQMAIELDPRHAGGYSAMATLRFQEGRWAVAEDLIKQALALDPSDPEVLNAHGFFLLLRTGRPKEALAVMRNDCGCSNRWSPSTRPTPPWSCRCSGQNEAAIARLESIPENTRSYWGTYISRGLMRRRDAMRKAPMRLFRPRAPSQIV